MKKLLFIVLLISCKNQKVEIVEQQKRLKEEILLEGVRASLFNSDATALTRTRNIDSLNDPGRQSRYISFLDSATAHELKKGKLQGRYDSLDMELKKY